MGFAIHANKFSCHKKSQNTPVCPVLYLSDCKPSFLDATEMKQIDDEISNDVVQMTKKDHDSENVFEILRGKIGK